MAHVVDTRSTGGDFVVIGKTLVPPHSTLQIEVGAEPMTASIRYNPEAQMIRPDNGRLVLGTLEIYLPIPGKAGVWKWERVGIDRDTSTVMYTSGATMSGDLIMRSLEPGAYNPQVLIAKGSDTLPGLAFDIDHATGLSYVEAGTDLATLRTSVNGFAITTANSVALRVDGDFYAKSVHTPLLFADLAFIDRLYGKYGYIEDLNANTLTANLGTIGHVISNLIDVVPVTGDDPDAIAEVLLIARGQEWIIAHGPAAHNMTFNFQGRNVMTLTPDDTVLIDHGIFKTVKADQIDTDTLHSNSITMNDVYASNSVTAPYLNATSMLHARAAEIDTELSADLVLANNANIANTVFAKTLSADNAYIGMDVVADMFIGKDALLSNGVTANTFSGFDAHLANTVVANTANVSNTITANTVVAAVFAATRAATAERYHADTFYEPGTVLVIGGSKEVTVTDSSAVLTVAGVIPNDPGYRLNDTAGTDEAWPLVALSGRVQCKVMGPVVKGDILVTSVVPGHAASATNPSSVPAAAIVGKALEDFADNSVGKILIKV